MSKVHTYRWAARSLALAGTLGAGILTGGCGTPGAPMPPSLNLPDRVTDLAAIRNGNQVSLTWTMPKKNTEKLLLKGNVPVRVCRTQAGGGCDLAGPELLLAPGAAGAFAETLPAALTLGAPRAVSYFVELKSHAGRSAGLSNAAVVLAGEAPPPVAGLTAEVRKAGIVLHWTPESGKTAVRLHRRLLTPPSAKPRQGLLTPPDEPLEQTLQVDAGGQAGRALDKDIRFGQTYEYRAQRVARMAAGAQTLELAGEISAPVRVEALDVFPPAVPTGLAAVAALGESGSETAIDLSWQPVTDVDLGGYAVYRREGQSGWRRISPAQPLVGPAFHDTQVQPGHSYRYAVSAIDQGGHESARSAEAEETVPTP